MDDLEILSHHDLVELCRRRTEQRDTLAAAIRAACSIVHLSYLPQRCADGFSIVYGALRDMERQDATNDR